MSASREPVDAAKRESGDLRPRIEAHASIVAESAIDVEPATVAEIELARRVSRIRDRDERPAEQGKFALPAVSVAGQDPALVASPAGAIRVSGLCESTSPARLASNSARAASGRN